LREERVAGRVAEARRELDVPCRARPQLNGGFADLDSLLEHLAEGPTIAPAVGKRPPKRQFDLLVQSQINRRLLGPVKIPPADASNSEEP
jgi:hypothetical protein